MHVFNLEPGSTMGTGDIFHQSTSRDGWIAREPDGSPSRVLVSAWRSVLGDKDADSYLDEHDNCPLVANAEQTDSDGNKIGDACGPTFAQGTVGGSVPATLALTLGAPATFGAFTPGVARSYETSTTATVTSTAGNAALSSSDPGRLTNGDLLAPRTAPGLLQQGRLDRSRCPTTRSRSPSSNRSRPRTRSAPACTAGR